jgi:hypothetical protein
MEIAVYAWGFISLALVTILTIVSLKGHAYVGLWLGVGTLIAATLGGGCWLHVYWRNLDAAVLQIGTPVTAADLAAPIEYLHVLITFKEPISAEWLLGKEIVVRLAGRGGGIDVLVQHGMRAHGGQQPWIPTFLTVCSVLGELFGRGNSLTDLTPTESLTTMVVPIRCQFMKKVPYTLVRDLNETSLTMFVPPELAEKISRVELVANASMGFDKRLVMLSNDVRRGSWNATQRDIRERFNDAKNLSDVWELTSTVDWFVDAHNAKWVQQEHPLEIDADSLEELRGPYRVALISQEGVAEFLSTTEEERDRAMRQLMYGTGTLRPVRPDTSAPKGEPSPTPSPPKKDAGD